MPLKCVRRPRSPHWIIRGTVRGVRIEESTGTADRALAEEIRAKREGEIYRAGLYGRAATATFAEAVASYIEAGGSRRFLLPILEHFGTAALASIDQDALDRGARKLFPRGGPATRNRQFFTPVSAVLHHAARRGWCSRPIIERPRQPDGRVRWLLPAEAERLIAACSPHLRPLVVFLLYTGARAGEALWLDWRDVDLSRAHVQFPETKSGKPRGAPLHRRVVAELASLPHREGEVFRRPDGLPYTRPARADDSSAGSRIARAFAGACRRASISDFTPHDCRHTFATWTIAGGIDLTTVSRALGHSSTLVTEQVYAHLVAEAQRPAVELVAAEIAPPSRRWRAR